ncbi:MAG TPA: type II 3-dehydroquinate dehydratase [bacterium]|nr:type II 3-dehydroquinate dehydratase [bacterium]
MRILVLNGPNLNLLGSREPAVYGQKSYDEIVAEIRRHCQQKKVQVRVQQTNHEGVLVDYIQQAKGVFAGIVINPAAYTHTSIAIPDALTAVGIPAVEVHLTDPITREAFRRRSYIRAACIDTVVGKGWKGYLEAVDLLLAYLQGKQKNE